MGTPTLLARFQRSPFQKPRKRLPDSNLLPLVVRPSVHLMLRAAKAIQLASSPASKLLNPGSEENELSQVMMKKRRCGNIRT